MPVSAPLPSYSLALERHAARHQGGLGLQRVAVVCADRPGAAIRRRLVQLLGLPQLALILPRERLRKGSESMRKACEKERKYDKMAKKVRNGTSKLAARLKFASSLMAQGSSHVAPHV